MPLNFIRPLTPLAADRPPKGDGWLHKPKWDSFRLQVIKDGNKVRFYSRNGTECTERLPKMRHAFVELAADSAILDGELCLIDPKVAAHFWRLLVEMPPPSTDVTPLPRYYGPDRHPLAFDRLPGGGLGPRI